MEITMLLVTSIIASALTIIFIKLSFAVISLRRQNKISLGSGGNDELERAIRAQGNFSEYVPIALILIGCLEINGAPWWLVALSGVSLIIGRLLHAIGISERQPSFKKRVLGMKFTFNTLILLIVMNVGWTIFKFVF